MVVLNLTSNVTQCYHLSSCMVVVTMILLTVFFLEYNTSIEIFDK